MNRNYEKTDLSFYDYYNGKIGDISVDNEGDLRLERSIDTIGQDIENRMRTQRRDWYFHPKIGADLELFIGERNDFNTAISMIQSIYATLTYDGLVSYYDVDVDVVPIEANKVEVFVFLISNPNGEKKLVFNEIIKL